ncbi:rod shape-determining protein MreC [Eudoraea sp.]|uniref:rod shape-determining protein MreC n=1 Tax=Eudoraea sp. TaxID=1979955 RepID=UPI003C74B982
MQQIINFIIRYKTSLLYLLLLLISLGFTIDSHSYHRSKFFNSSNRISGSIYNTADGITQYFNLNEENKKLVEENKKLRILLFNPNIEDSVQLDTTKFDFAITPGRIIKNSYSSPNNYITINRGTNHGIKQDMGVITAKGILGIVEHTTKNYASVQSILNTKSNINAKIKNTNYFGSLVWDGRGYNQVKLEDIPRLVPLLVGDTIVTGAMSSIFPENIPIGTIKKFDLNVSKSFYSIDVELFNDMSNVKNIYIINNKNRPEILELEAKIANDQ